MAITLGTKITTGGVYPGLAISRSASQQRAFGHTLFLAPNNGYITHLGANMRSTSGTAYVYLALYALDLDGTPGKLLARTARFPINSTAGGLLYEMPIVWSAASLGGAQTSVRLVAGQRFALAVKVDNADMQMSSLAGTSLNWRRSVTGTGAPTDPFAPTSTGVEVNPSIYALFEENRQPTATLSSPANAAALNTTTPTFSGTFVDPDSSAPMSDRMSAYAIEVVRQDNNDLYWGGAGATFSASATERSTGVFTHIYSGALLPPGSGPYTWRARVFDDSGASSDWSAPRSFTINAAGQIDTSDATSPPAKVDTASSAIDWQGRWYHPTGLAMNAAQVRILVEDVVLLTGSLYSFLTPVSSTSPPGTLFTVPAAGAGIGPLAPGRRYSYQIQGRATDGQFSPWSIPKGFVVNSPPTVPANLQPPNGAVSTRRPLAEWNVSDPDPDDIYGVDDDSEILLTRPNATTITITTPNYDPLTGKGFYQFSTTDVLDAVRGRYSWRVRGRDLSAGTVGLGGWSLTQTFDYLAGPLVDILAPVAGSVVTTSVPIISWSVSGATQAQYQVRAYNVDAPSAFATSPVFSGNVNTFQAPTGWFKNNSEYDIEVVVWDAANNRGISLRRQFRVQYVAPPTVTNVEISLYTNRYDPIIAGIVEPSSVLLAFDPSLLPPNEFAGYLIRRRRSDESIDDAIVLPTITAIGQSRWFDHLAPPNVSLLYTVSQLRRVSSVEVLESPAVEVGIELPRRVPILCSAIRPGELRFPAMWLSESLSGDFERDQSVIKTWGARGKRTNLQVPPYYGAKSVTISVTIRGDDRGRLYDHLDVIDDLIESGDTLCWAPERPRERMFCALNGKTPWRRSQSARTRTLSLIEVDWVEGIRVGG